MTTARLRRVVGPLDGVTVVVSSIIGAGIFATPQRVALHFATVEGMLALWIAGALLALFGGMVMAELGSRLPRSGGSYVWITNAFGPRVGFLEGWRSFMITNPASRAGLAVVAAEYVGHFIELDPSTHTHVAGVVLIAAGVLNYTGMRWSLRFQHLSVMTKAGALVLASVVGLALLPELPTQSSPITPPDASLSSSAHVLAAALLVYYSYTGYSRLGYLGAEIRDPQRTFPRAILTGVTVVAVTYLVINLLYLDALGLHGMRNSSAVAADAAGVLLGPSGASLVASIVIVSASGTVVTTMMASARTYYAMARDHLFFRQLDFVHPVYRTPSRAVALHTVACLVMLYVKRSFVDLAMSFVFVSLMFTILRVLALFRFRARRVNEARAYRLPLFPLVPLAYLASVIALVGYRIAHDWDRAAFDLAVLVIGIPAAEIWIRIKRARGEPLGSYAAGPPEEDPAAD